MIPKVVSFGFTNYKVVNKKQLAECKMSGSEITD